MDPLSTIRDKKNRYEWEFNHKIGLHVNLSIQRDVSINIQQESTKTFKSTCVAFWSKIEKPYGMDRERDFLGS